MTPVEESQLRCRLYATGVVKPGTTFTYLTPASHRARANGDGPEGLASGEEPSGSSPHFRSAAAPASDVTRAFLPGLRSVGCRDRVRPDLPHRERENHVERAGDRIPEG